jgi:microsomal dipeptidase-like Zn-dependent dipeptidase
MGLPAPEGFERVDKLPYLYGKLIESGFSEEDIKNIAYRNALRVLMKNLE